MPTKMPQRVPSCAKPPDALCQPIPGLLLALACALAACAGPNEDGTQQGLKADSDSEGEFLNSSDVPVGTRFGRLNGGVAAKAVNNLLSREELNIKSFGFPYSPTSILAEILVNVRLVPQPGGDWTAQKKSDPFTAPLLVEFKGCEFVYKLGENYYDLAWKEQIVSVGEGVDDLLTQINKTLFFHKKRWKLYELPDNFSMKGDRIRSIEYSDSDLVVLDGSAKVYNRNASKPGDAQQMFLNAAAEIERVMNVSPSSIFLWPKEWENKYRGLTIFYTIGRVHISWLLKDIEDGVRLGALKQKLGIKLAYESYHPNFAINASAKPAAEALLINTYMFRNPAGKSGDHFIEENVTDDLEVRKMLDDTL